MPIIRCVFIVFICLLCTICIQATEPSYRFLLTVDGQSEKQVQTGDTVTVYCILEQDREDVDNILYAFQNEIEYDQSFFKIDADSFMKGDASVVVNTIQHSARIQELYVNYLSMSGGATWSNQAKVCLFQMEILGNNGVGRLHCQDYSVSKPDGSGSYPVTAEDLLLVVNDNCILDFDTGTGTAVPSQTVKRYEKANEPTAPVRPGYRFVGWFTDEGCTEPWHYDDPVLYNMYIYAGWESEDSKVFPFTDVARTDWFYEGVSYAVTHELMNGVSETEFDPNGTTSRAMLVTILWRLAGKPQVDYAMTFTDVENEQWYTEAIRWAAGTGIVKGYSDTEFGLNDPVTREQMAVILYRYVQMDTQQNGVETVQSDVLKSYQDAEKISIWAWDGLSWAVQAELLRGVGDNMLSPDGNASRAQSATILMRFCEMNDAVAYRSA